MKKRLEEWPSWAEQALQGVTYWIGHRRSLYPYYPLAEAALVAEVCNLIHANLNDGYSLKCEVRYTEFLPGVPHTSDLTERARIDLVVAEKVRKNGNVRLKPRFAIEVKRASASTASINADLRRLASVRAHKPEVRAFLFVISEAARPGRFVSDEGKSILGRHRIPSGSGHFRVRRTWKAARAFKGKNSAHYACLIEIYGHEH